MQTVTIETIDVDGPVETVLPINEAVPFTNAQIRNNKSIYLNGSPTTIEFINESNLDKIKIVTIMNKLVGG